MSSFQDLKKLSENFLQALEQIGEKFSQFQKSSRLPCVPECGGCCFNPQIYCSPFDMLPVALALIENKTAEQTYEFLQELLNNKPLSHCIFLKVDDAKKAKGTCTQYTYRPLICRVFAVSARHNKLGKVEFSVCKTIQEANPKAYTELLSKTEHLSGEELPFIDHSKSPLAEIFPFIHHEEYPINEALLKMLDKLLFLREVDQLKVK